MLVYILRSLFYLYRWHNIVRRAGCYQGDCCRSISASDCSMCSGNLTRPNCALNKMLLICNFANCFSLIPLISFSSFATCRPNISSASMSSAVPLPDPLPAECVADRGVCFSLLVTRIFKRFACKLLECFCGSITDESVDDSDTSAPGDADMPLSIFESYCASKASVCATNIENTNYHDCTESNTYTNKTKTHHLQINHSCLLFIKYCYKPQKVVQLHKCTRCL